MDLGFAPDLAAVSTVSAVLTKLVVYPLVRARRRRDTDGDGQLEDTPTGAFVLHPALHGVGAIGLLTLGAVTFAAATGEPLFPVLAAVMTGSAVARAAHETTNS